MRVVDRCTQEFMITPERFVLGVMSKKDADSMVKRLNKGVSNNWAYVVVENNYQLNKEDSYRCLYGEY